MDKREIAAVLDGMADLLELAEENPFRARSFRNAARTLEALPEDLGELMREGRIREVRGIGETLAGIIAELWRDGRSDRCDELRARVPPGLLEMLRVSGLGPKRARIIHEKLGVAGLDALEEACRANRVAGLPGFGEKLEKKILAGIEAVRKTAGRFLSDQAGEVAAYLLEAVRRDPAVLRAEVAGSLRRRKETVKDIDIVASSTAPAGVMERFAGLARGGEVIARGDTKTSIRLPGGIAADLRVVADSQYPFALLYFTGSMEHNTALRGRAKARGMKLNEYGLFRVKGDGGEGDGAGEPVPCASEEEAFRALGLSYIPPELREDMGEIGMAEAGPIPRLVEPGDLRGLIHIHTTASDGRCTIEQLVEAARSRGYEYLAICDHSQSAAYAGGLKEEAVRAQHREIDALNARLRGFRILKGIESDIRPDGSLDYPPEVLDSFDLVIASVHSGFNLPEEEQTARVIRAMRDPHCTILGHPTGRLLLSREGIRIRMEEVLRAAAELGVIVEINANPHRLDLDWRWGRLVRELGIRVCISPDAHSLEDIDYNPLGVGIARKMGLPAEGVANTRPAEEFLRLAGHRRLAGKVGTGGV